jgi:DNA-binding NarL/FixJ family response regulator
MRFLRLHITIQLISMESHASGSNVIAVYIADNECLYQGALKRILAGIPGIRIVGRSSNGTDALQNIRLLRPDVVLLDVDVPEMNGVEVVSSMRSEGISSIVMMLSDYATPFHRQAAIAAGADYYLDKFFDSQQIGPILDSLVRILSDRTAVISR